MRSQASAWSGSGWTITVTDTELAALLPSGRITVGAGDASRLVVRRRWLRWRLYDGDRLLLGLPGLSHAGSKDLGRAITRLWLNPAISASVAWYERVTEVLEKARVEQRWVPRETLDMLLVSRPPQGLRNWIRAAGVDAVLGTAETKALDLVDGDLVQVVASVNRAVMSSELVTRREFFQTIEKSPLTEEQAEAVICFDNRVQVLAAAGSGKTSLMVARAAYAVNRGLVAPDRILLLAFNRAAADELEERIQARFSAAGIDPKGVRASTFHSFGLDVIGRATGIKPRLASWVDVGDGLGMIERIVDELRDRDLRFRYRWDLYRLVFAHASIAIDEHEPDAWDASRKENGYHTFGGHIVRSHGERLIADFLFLNGVSYDYERPYVHDVADATHGQYRPDFYYPDIDVWHEHWALDREDKPPASFHGYAQSMEWKRRIHAQYRTTLVETTFAGVLWGNGLEDLAAELTRRGLTLDWDPERAPKDEWAKPVRHEDLYRLVRTFMTHVKSNSWTRADIERRLETDARNLAGYKTRLFLDLYWAIAEEWERHLAEEGSVDFEDMLVQAAEHLETGRVDPGYELVMVDEFQDASRARARLVRGLVAKPGRYLLAVGDDWQSINRFAGADLSVMTEFSSWFGAGPQLALTTTFRCSQAICDVASGFVSKNPAQFKKVMRSSHLEAGVPVKVLASDDATAALARYLRDLSEGVANGTVPAGASGTVTIDVLGRYHSDRSVMPCRLPRNLDVTFRTMHSSKGLEAEYVVLPCMVTGTNGFPSTITDDPVLHLSMPVPDTYEHAEERRLFYVALTRARRAVTLITEPRRMSPFITELIGDNQVAVENNVASGQPTRIEVCPACKKGTLVERKGRYGKFLGCSAYPRCTHTRNIR